MHAADSELARLSERAAGLREAGRVPEAIVAYQRLLALCPGLPNSWYNLALLQRRARRPEAALAAYDQALSHGIAEPEEVHLNRAVIFSDDLRRPHEAERELRLALSLRPDYAPALLNLGNLHEDRGERDAARACYEALLASDPGSTDALARLAGLGQVAHIGDPLVRRLQQALRRDGASAAARADLGFALGRLLDGCAAYDEAFAAFVQANRDSRASAVPPALYDRAAQEAEVTALMQAFAAPASRGIAAPAPPRPAPVFICGMFRSGSTLVERVLASHPRVTAGGELDTLPALAGAAFAATPHAGAAPNITPQPALAAAYRAELARLFPGADIVTDKRPDNLKLIGLIKTLFPEAKIVHTVRDPLDTCLSVHFLHLAHSRPYALDLLDTGHYLQQCRRLMAHWKTLYGDDILDFDYDAFVQAPKPALESLLAFCGLDWHEPCLDFHRTAGAVRTASVWQVREPLYTRSSGRWRHYAHHLGPLRAMLRDDTAAAP